MILFLFNTKQPALPELYKNSFEKRADEEGVNGLPFDPLRFE